MVINQIQSISNNWGYKKPDPIREYSINDSLAEDTSAYSAKIYKIQNHSENLVNYIQKLKQDFILSAGYKVNETGDTILRNPHDREFTTNFFVHNRKGLTLQDSIKATKSYLSNLIEGKNKGAIQTNAILISASDSSVPNYDKEQKTWVEYTFHNIPAIAAITILTKIQTDMRNTEYALIQYMIMEKQK